MWYPVISAGIKAVTKNVVSSDIGPGFFEIIEKLENNSGCERKVWFDQALSCNSAMLSDDSVDVTSSTVCQDVYADSPLRRFFRTVRNKGDFTFETHNRFINENVLAINGMFSAHIIN
jgi:hypothetical protein